MLLHAEKRGGGDLAAMNSALRDVPRSAARRVAALQPRDVSTSWLHFTSDTFVMHFSALPPDRQRRLLKEVASILEIDVERAVDPHHEVGKALRRTLGALTPQAYQVGAAATKTKNVVEGFFAARALRFCHWCERPHEGPRLLCAAWYHAIHAGATAPHDAPTVHVQ